MDEIKFMELKNDNRIIYIERKGLRFFRDVNKEIAIEFFCELLSGTPNKNKSRITLKVFPFESLNESWHSDIIDGNITIMTNGEEYESAMLYNLSVDTKNRVVELRMVEQPNSEIWKMEITQEEFNGIKVNFEGVRI